MWGTVPHGKIFDVPWSQDGESLGIQREGGNGEVWHTLGYCFVGCVVKGTVY